MSFHKEKMRMRMLHKRLRAGLMKWDELTEQEKDVLQRYYGW